MSTRRALGVTGAAALHVLTLTHESGDIFPPLKHVAGGALSITELVVKFRTSKKEWEEFSIYVRDIIATLIDSLESVDPEQTEISNKLEKLRSTLNEVGVIEARQREWRGMRIFRFIGHLDMIEDMRRKIDDAVYVFKFDSTINTGIKVDKTLQVAKNTNELMSEASVSAMLKALTYIEGASWDLHRVCLANTRSHIIEEVLSWVNNGNKTRDTNIDNRWMFEEPDHSPDKRLALFGLYPPDGSFQRALNLSSFTLASDCEPSIEAGECNTVATAF